MLRVGRLSAALAGVAFAAATLVTTAPAAPIHAAAAVRVTQMTAGPRAVSRYAGVKRVTVRYRLNTKAKVTVWIGLGTSPGTRRLLNNAVHSAGFRSVTWDLKNSSGSYVPNGNYKVNVKAIGTAGATGSSQVSASIRVDSTKPSCPSCQVASPTIAPAIGETTAVRFRPSDNYLDLPVSATLEILDASGAIVSATTTAGLTPAQWHTMPWDGRRTGGAIAGPGIYRVRVRITDAASNAYVSPEATVYVNDWGVERELDPLACFAGIVRGDADVDSTHLVYNTRSPGGGVRYVRLDMAGNTLVSSVVVTTTQLDDAGERGVADVAASPDGGAWVTWRGTGLTTSHKAIWLARIEPSGRVKWSRRILDESGSSRMVYDPRVSCGPNGLAHVVCWQSGSNTAILYAAYRTDGVPALTWSALAAGSGGQQRYPNVEADSLGRIHFVWFDSTDHPNNSGKREIYYSRIAFAGTSLSPANSIQRKRLTTTEMGYSPGIHWAPELTADSAGALHIVWPDQTSAAASKGTMYLKLAPAGTTGITPRRVFDGVAPATNRYGDMPGVVALPGGGACVVTRARAGLSAPPRLWQVDVSSVGASSKPVMITDGAREDDYPALAAGPDGSGRLLYFADTGVLRAGSIVRRLTYKDLLVEARSNDTTRPDLQIDSAHWSWTSAQKPPRQNTPIQLSVRVGNHGWVPSAGGTAVLECEGIPVDTKAIAPLARDASTTVSLGWTVPDDATRTPAALRVKVYATAETTQSTTRNDQADVPVAFIVPPTSATVLLDVFDETEDPDRFGGTLPLNPTATLSGTTLDGAPYPSTGTSRAGWFIFRDVPLGSYTVVHSAPGYVTSPPSSQPLTIARDPADRYRLVVTPGGYLRAWVNQWGTIDGRVVESGGTTPVVGASVKILQSGETSTTAAGGTFLFGKLRAGDYQLKTTKPGYARTTTAQIVAPSTTHALTIPLARTTKGYLMGAVLDESGAAAINDPDSTSDDPVMTVRGAGIATIVQTLHDGTFDLELPAGDYKVSFSSPGFLSKTDLPVTIRAGVETDKTTELELDISALNFANKGERWMVAWTQNANFGGSQPYESPWPGFDTFQWLGLSRFTLSAAYQDVGTNRYIRLVKPTFVGEAYLWHYVVADVYVVRTGVTAPDAPTIFEYGQPELDEWTSIDDLPRDVLGDYIPWIAEDPTAGSTSEKYQPPMLIEGSRWNRTAIRMDGVDVVDQRDRSVVSQIRSHWNSCESAEHLYGNIGTYDGDGAFGTYSHAVPWNQQLIRMWITVGKMDENGNYGSSPFGDISGMDRGEMMQTTGSNELALYWRPCDGTLWVEPALTDYPPGP